MTTQNKKRTLSLLFFTLGMFLVIILLVTLKIQRSFLDEGMTPAEILWENLWNENVLKSDKDLTFVRMTKYKSKKIYEFLYSRRYTGEEIGNRVGRLLKSRGLEIGHIKIDNITGDVSIELMDRETPYVEIMYTPDMSTSAGRIVLIIDDMGYHIDQVVKKLLDFDIPITFSILPGHTYSKRIAMLASEAGHEVMVHMPMDTKDHRAGEGEFLIKRGMRRKEIASRLRKALLEIPQAKGINNHQGSDATEDHYVMRAVADVLRSEKKFFIDSRTSPKTVGVEEMVRAGVPVAVRSVFLDYQDEKGVVQEQLKSLSKKARKSGLAIGIAHPKRNTLDVLKKEIPLLHQQGFEFIFASEAVHLNTKNDRE